MTIPATAEPTLSHSESTRDFDVLILGGGFAGVWAARKAARRKNLKVGLIADQNVMLFHPMLAEVCGASISPRHIVNPIRNLCPGTEVFLASVRDIDFSAKRLHAQAGPQTAQSVFTYRHLVIALGGVVDLSRVPGMAEHALPMKTIGDAFGIRSTVIDRLEEAHLAEDPAVRRALLTFAVIGGGYSGVETAGQIADLLHEARRLFPWLHEAPPHVILIHSGPFLLPQIGEKLGRFAEKKLAGRGVEILLNTRVAAVTADKVHLPDKIISVRTVVTTVGNAPHPLVLDLGKRRGLPLDKGRIVTQPGLKVPELPGVWSAGDCALVLLPDGTWAPATAQFAQRQGELLGKNILREIDGQPTEPFAFTGLGELASIGHHNAVAKIFGFTFSGFFAWWMWRSIYLSKLPGIERKLRVMIDWTLDVIFPRDLSLLRINTTPRLATIHVETGDAVYSTGDQAFSFYILRQGAVEIRDREGPIKEIEPGDHFGENELFDGKPRGFDAVATRPSELLVLNRGMFESLSLASPDFAAHLKSSALQYTSREKLAHLLSRVPEEIRRTSVAARMKRDVVSIPAGSTIEMVLRGLKDHDYTTFPVVDPERRPLGVIHRGHFLDLLQTKDFAPDTAIPPEAIEPVPTLGEDQTLEAALQRMIRMGHKVFFATDVEGRLTGVLSLVDAVID